MLDLSTWRPPGTLQGHFYLLELLHDNGQWVPYTEHHNEADAKRLCRDKRFNYPTNQWRVRRTFRPFAAA